MDDLVSIGTQVGTLGLACVLVLGLLMVYEKFRRPRIAPEPAPDPQNNLGKGGYICKEFRDLKDAVKDLTTETKKQGNAISRLEGIITGQGRGTL